MNIKSQEENEKITEIMHDTCDFACFSVNSRTGPFACIITDSNYNIISKEHNRVTELNDPTAHAEINAIRDACKKIGTFDLSNKIMFTSCEPCSMCLSAIYWSRIQKIYYSNTREDAKNIGFDDSYIYEEIKKNVDDRDVKLERVLPSNSLKSFEIWKNKIDKIQY